MANTVNAYPFWNPQGAGEAANFALPVNLSEVQTKAIISDSERLKIPQEVTYSQNNIPIWQYVPAFVPPPQGPAQIKDPYTQARSLLDYARSTLGTSALGVEDKRGQEGRASKVGK